MLTKRSKRKLRIQTQKNKIQEKKLINEWKGKLLGENTHIQIFRIPNNNKRKYIIKITTKDNFKNIEGSLLALRILPPSTSIFNFKGKTIYRLSLYYGARGSYQGGPKVSFKGHKVLFSENEKEINKIKEMLSKYTKDIKIQK